MDDCDSAACSHSSSVEDGDGAVSSPCSISCCCSTGDDGELTRSAAGDGDGDNACASSRTDEGTTGAAEVGVLAQEKERERLIRVGESWSCRWQPERDEGRHRDASAGYTAALWSANQCLLRESLRRRKPSGASVWRIDIGRTAAESWRGWG